MVKRKVEKQASTTGGRVPKAGGTAAGPEDEDEELVDDLGDELEASDYSGESDVFEDDVAAILFREAQKERARGFAAALVEEPASVVEYPFPAYLAQLPALFSDRCAFGRDPEQYIYCHNLLVRRLLPMRTMTWKWADLGVCLLTCRLSRSSCR